jgi:hypothetical protein
VLASNVVLIGSPASQGVKPASTPSPALTLVSTNGTTFVFSYTGASSGLTNGQVLVSTDPNAPYKRKILSLTDNPASHTVSLVTAQASLAECLQGGSLRLVGDSSKQPSGAAFQPASLAPASLGASIPLAGTVIYDNGTIRVEVTSGQITFNPDFTISGTFDGNRLTAFDSEISGTIGLDMTLQASAQAMGDFDGSSPLTTPRRTFRLLGFVGVVPVWVEAVLEFNIGYEAHLEATGTATWGFESSRTLTLGATLRNGQWNPYQQQFSSFTPFTPAWQINGSARVQGYVEPKLTVYLESLAGASADLKPYLELEFGVRFVNASGRTLNRINVQFTAELWRQSAVGKTLEVSYYLDPIPTNAFPTNLPAALPELDVRFPTLTSATKAIAVEGASPVNQSRLGITNQIIADWQPGTALWLVWQMKDSSAKGQGLAIDDFSFSASTAPAHLSVALTGRDALLSWPEAYSNWVLESTGTLDPQTSWSPVNEPSS